MGKAAWARHAAKPPPVAEYEVEDNVKVVIRKRSGAPRFGRFVATVRYIHPPQKGAYVITYAYGATADAAEVRALDAYRRR